jgi:hypothetical protein
MGSAAWAVMCNGSVHVIRPAMHWLFYLLSLSPLHSLVGMSQVIGGAPIARTRSPQGLKASHTLVVVLAGGGGVRTRKVRMATVNTVFGIEQLPRVASFVESSFTTLSPAPNTVNPVGMCMHLHLATCVGRTGSLSASTPLIPTAGTAAPTTNPQTQHDHRPKWGRWWWWRWEERQE